MDIGPLFVENRYARPESRRYRPHQALRNLWGLSHVVDPVRLRMELLNPGKRQEVYEGDPLAPCRWPADALFAITMMASPLGWMELSDVSEEVRAAWRPLVSRWKKERSVMHSGTILPIGDEPDGWAWTGFFSCAKDASCAYALLFREQNEDDDFDLDISPLVPPGTRFSKAEVIGGRGKAELDDDGLDVEIPAKLDFVWVKLTK
jgi:alpha-galactosidase